MYVCAVTDMADPIADDEEFDGPKQYQLKLDEGDISIISMSGLRGKPDKPDTDTYAKSIRSAFLLLAHTKVSSDFIDYVEQGVPETRYFPSMVALQLYLTGDFDGDIIKPDGNEYVAIGEKPSEENEEQKKTRIKPAFDRLIKVTQAYDDWLASKLIPPKQAADQPQAPARHMGNDFQTKYTYVYDTILYRVLISRFACDNLVMHRMREHDVLRQLLAANEQDIVQKQTNVSEAAKTADRAKYKEALDDLVQYVNKDLYNKFKELATPPTPPPSPLPEE